MSFIPAAGLSIAGVVFALIFAAWGTRPLSPWYQGLTKPSWQPEPAAIGLAWSVIYPLIVIASVMVLVRADQSTQRVWLIAFAINMILNALWSWLFFVLRAPYVGSIGLALLVVSVFSLIMIASSTWLLPTVLLLPYLAWSVVAFSVNFTIARLN